MIKEDFLPCDNEKLNQLLLFTAEVDKMTSVFRRTLLIDKSRRENDAEHSWHIALMAMIFKDFSPKGVDINRAVKMCIIHDLVEIYAGDTFAYDTHAIESKKERESIAAQNLFSKLPVNTGLELKNLWEEFDLMESLDSKYASCMDRLQPFLHNTLTEGHTWKESKTSASKVYKRLEIVKEVIPELWDWVEKNISNAIKKGWLISD